MQLQKSMPEGTQAHFRSIVTDRYLRAVGSDGSIIALGDGATVEQVGLRVCRKLLHAAYSYS